MSTETELKRLSLNQQLEQLLVQSFCTTFQMMWGVDPKYVIEPATAPHFNKEITASVAFYQQELEGILSISCDLKTAFNTFSKFYGSDIKVLETRVIEGMGEIMNMIFGQVKEHYNNNGCDYSRCLPIVVVGRHHEVFSVFKGGTLRHIQFESDLGVFQLEIFFHS